MNIIVISHWRVLKLITRLDFEVAEVKEIGNLYLVRHPETSLNAENCLRGHTDIGLTDKGVRQIDTILKQLKDNNATAVYSSDLSRVISTATRIAQLYDLPLFFTKDLRPADLGELTGKYIDKNVKRILQEIDDAGDDGQFPKGESIKQFKHRINNVFNYLRGK